MLQITEDTVFQKTSWAEKTWTFAELLESHDPLSEESLTEQTAAFQKAAQAALKARADYSSDAQRQIDFWTNFQPQKLAWHAAIFKTTVDGNFQWEIKINEIGIYFRDVSGQYDTYDERVSAQLFSDFWFFGPLRPIPDLGLREQLLNTLKNGFVNPDSPVTKMHFGLFEYPEKSPSNLHWEEGNHVRSDYVTVRQFGIEMGYTTFRDGPFGPGILSFERFLHLPQDALHFISPAMREQIEAYLGQSSSQISPKPEASAPKPLTPREQMDLAESLLQDPNSEEGAEKLLSLLPYETESDYWRNYVFNRCFKLRDNRKIQQFISDCLEGDNETWFIKSRDVLVFWGFHGGDKLLADRTLLNALNWDDASANDPDFREALVKVQKIIQGNT